MNFTDNSRIFAEGTVIFLGVTQEAGPLDIDLGNAELIIAANTSVNANIDEAGVNPKLILDGGTLTGNILDYVLERFEFSESGGTLNLTNSSLVIGSGLGFLGSSPTLTRGQAITLISDPAALLTIGQNATVTIADGRLATSQINVDELDGGALDFISGSLELANSSLTIGNDPSSFLGNTVDLTHDKSLLLGNMAMIEFAGTLAINDGSLAASDIDNSGGDGNDVVLATIPEPMSVVLLLVAAIVASCCRQRPH